MRRGTKFSLVAGGLLLLLAVVAGWRFRHHNGEVKYTTAAVTRGDIASSITATGTINPVTTVQVGSQVSGTIAQLMADYNSPVQAGDVIAQIDPALFKAQLGQAEGTLTKAQADLTQTERTLRRMTTLLERGLVSQNDVDQAQTARDTAAGEVARAGAARDVAATNLRYTTIVSPVDGVVIARNVDVGQTVAASLQAPTLFTIAKDLTVMQIDTHVDEADIGGVAESQRARFTVDAFPDDTFEGTVTQVRNAPIIDQNVVKYDVVVGVANPELKLKPGMTANVTVITSGKQGVLLVPNAALRFKPPKSKADEAGAAAEPAGRRRGGTARVWLLDRGVPQPREVAVGIADDKQTEVVSGLREGEQVVTAVVAAKGKKPQSSPFSPRMRF